MVFSRCLSLLPSCQVGLLDAKFGLKPQGLRKKVPRGWARGAGRVEARGSRPCPGAGAAPSSPGRGGRNPALGAPAEPVLVPELWGAPQDPLPGARPPPSQGPPPPKVPALGVWAAPCAGEASGRSFKDKTEIEALLGSCLLAAFCLEGISPHPSHPRAGQGLKLLGLHRRQQEMKFGGLQPFSPLSPVSY